MRKPKIDPVLSALIAKLPASGAAWSVEQRTAWFEMMWLACTSVYGGPVGGGMPSFSPREASTNVTDLGARMPSITTIGASTKQLPAFFIDAQGIAQNADGKRITPKDVGGAVIVDLRGEHGDLGAIQWADGSTGVRGHQLEITTSVS